VSPRHAGEVDDEGSCVCHDTSRTHTIVTITIHTHTLHLKQRFLLPLVLPASFALGATGHAPHSGLTPRSFASKVIPVPASEGGILSRARGRQLEGEDEDEDEDEDWEASECSVFGHFALVLVVDFSIGRDERKYFLIFTMNMHHAPLTTSTEQL